MKKSGYKSVLHIYSIFFAILIGITVIGLVIFLNTIMIQKPNGELGRSDWAKQFTESFSNQIIFINGKPEIKDSGLKELKEYKLWIQILDKDGKEHLRYQTPKKISTQYTPYELLQLYRNGNTENTTSFIGEINDTNTDWVYIIGFPLDISKITMYFDANKFGSGKGIIITLISVLFLFIIIAGFIYGIWITRKLSKMEESTKNLVKRCYIPIESKGMFKDMYDSLNTLEVEIKYSDEVQARNEQMQEEWISNITHDLKAPLSPIKGYAELMADSKYNISEDDMRRYGKIILKDSIYAQELIDDLKITYQLKNSIFPLKRIKEDIVRFTKEIVIDILNNPKYENRSITFLSIEEELFYDFDKILIKRALNNLIVNSLIHTDEVTEIFITLTKEVDYIKIDIQDNGKGMNENQLKNIFTRYYRGKNTEDNPKGTGLGMSIAKQIIEIHDGEINVNSIKDVGTNFVIKLILLD